MGTDEKEMDKNSDGLTLKEFVKLRFDDVDKKLDTLDAEVRSLQITRALLEGKASQTSVVIAYVIAGVGLIVSLVDYFTAK